jgi:hypothetical protein
MGRATCRTKLPGHPVGQRFRLPLGDTHVDPQCPDLAVAGQVGCCDGLLPRHRCLGEPLPYRCRPAG